MRRVAPAEREAIRQRFLRGESPAVIAREFPFLVTTIRNHVRDLFPVMFTAAFADRAALLARIQPSEAGWVGGVVDGEGMITVIHQRGLDSLAGRISVANTDIRMVEKMKALCGGVCRQGTQDPRPRNRPLYLWTLTSLPEIGAFCEWIAPYLVIKREHAVLLAEFVALRRARYRKRGTPARAWEIANQIRTLNHISLPRIEPNKQGLKP